MSRPTHIHMVPKSEIDDNVQIYPIDILQMGGDGSNSLVPDIAYYYLQKTIGLSEETMWKITLEAGSVLGMTPRNLEKKVSLLRRTMDLSDDNVREILEKQPAILHLSADRNLAPTILLLVRALDLSKSELRSIIMTCPSILGYSSDNLKRKLSFFINTLGYNREKDGKDKVRDLFLLEPKLLSCGVQSGLVPRKEFLHREIHFTLKDLRKLYAKNPRLLIYSLDNNLREKIVFFFILQLQMQPEHVRKMLMAYPKVMDYNLENNMKPIAQYFLTELEFSAIEMRSIILRFPRVFTHSLFKIKHVIGFLRYELALDAQQVKRVIFQAPQILGLDTEGNLKAKLNFLQQRIDLTQQELSTFIAKMPTIFSLSVETSLIPKIKYLQSILHSTCEVKDVLLKQPVLLGYSLNRIQYRMATLLQAGISPRKITVAISMSENNFLKWTFSSRSKLEAAQFNSSSAMYLCNNLNFTTSEVDDLSIQLPNFSRSSARRLRSKVSYLKRVFEDEDLKSLILQHPVLIDASRGSQVKRRISKLQMVGLPLVDQIETLSWNIEDFEKWILPFIERVRVENEYNSIIEELDSIEDQNIHVRDAEYPCAKKSGRRIVEHVLAHFNDKEKVKSVLLSFPEILELNQSMVRTLLDCARLANVSDKERIGELLVNTKHWTKPVGKLQPWIDILVANENRRSDVLVMPHMKAEKHLLKLFLTKRMHFKSEEVSKILDVLPTGRSFLNKSIKKIDFLLREVYDNSLDSLKQGLLSNPTILQKSLERTIIPRFETAQYLKSIGVEYTPNDVGSLITQTPSKYAEVLAPGMKTWDGQSMKLEGDELVEDNICTALQEYAPSLVLSSSHDFNRDDAQVVYWH